MNDNDLVYAVRREQEQSRFMFDLMSGKYNERSALREASRLGVQTEGRNYLVLIFRSRSESLASLLIDPAGLVQEYCKRHGQAWAMCMPRGLVTAVVGFPAEKNNLLDDIMIDAEKLRELLSKATARQVISAMSEPEEKPHKLCDAFDSACNALLLSSFLGQEQLRYERDKSRIAIPGCHADELSAFLSAIETGDLSEARREADIFIESCVSDGLPKRHYEELFREIGFAVEYTMVKAYGAEPESFMKDDTFYESLRSINDRQTLRNCVLRSLNAVLPSTEAEGLTKPQIRRAMQYIRENCAEHITLNSTADQLGISPAYFSKLFRQETGMNYTAYLTRCRIERAKNLLLDPSLKIYEIAEMSGFSDVQYFNRVFRSTTGISPNSYRQNASNVGEGVVYFDDVKKSNKS